MKKLAILGLGHIGKYVHDTLWYDPSFSGNISGYDLSTGYDISNEEVVRDIVKENDGVLASTPFFLNKMIAKQCDENNCDYFDLTESVEVTDYVKTLSNARFVTQCGLAPGMVSIIAQHQANKFNSVEKIEIRVGALPASSSNHLGYYRTWSTEGLINEYIHPCPSVKNGKLTLVNPVEDFENITFGGMQLEAANTSGGLGSLADTWQGIANTVNYKTLRYPGHWDLIRFLKDDLGLSENFDVYVKLFNSNIPQTKKDVVYILINVTGDGNVLQQYSIIIPFFDGVTAIQRATGSGVMAVLDIWNMGSIDQLGGWIKQEELIFQDIWNSKYSKCYKS